MSADDGAQTALLDQGRLEIVGRVQESSNATYVVEASSAEQRHWAIYKPVSGERPLWDFEPGLHRRERAAYLLDRWLGWNLVPTTVLRDEAPLGVGSLQWFIDFSPTEHYFTLLRGAPQTHPSLRRMAAFDVVANNTDRKGGHVLSDPRGRIWGIDHGLCFAAEAKLRTVIWDFAGEKLDDQTLADLARLADGPPDEVAELLDSREVRALRRRARRLADSGRLPSDTTGRAWPWPLI